MSGRVIARGIGLGIAALLLNAVFAFLWVWLYAVALDPGHDGAFYQAYGQRVAPVAGMVAGLPLLFAAGWLAGRGQGSGVAALTPALTYILLDLALMAGGALWSDQLTLILSDIARLLAAWAGGHLASGHRP